MKEQAETNPFTGGFSEKFFGRIFLGLTGALALFSLRDGWALAQRLGIDVPHSKTWLALLGSLGLLGALCLAGLAVLLLAPEGGLARGLSGAWARLESTAGRFRAAGWLVLPAGLAVYPLIYLYPYTGDLLAHAPWLKGMIFWLAVLVSALGLRLALGWNALAGPVLVSLLLESAAARTALYLPNISLYPFAMGWSETSRFYYPALFAAQKVFGEKLAWPILHPSLHLLLTPPYWVGAPLWFHRAWQVILRLAFPALVGPALLSRLQVKRRALRWLAGLWVFVYLLSLPLYLHLAVPVFLMLWGFDPKKPGRAWLWLCIASIWAGLSRLNWYPVPGILAAVIYALEVPAGRKGWRALWLPAAWFVCGTALAFFSMQVYIRFSGLANVSAFYTSLNSSKLWYRLLPNESYWLGVLPGIVIFSLPLWLGLAAFFRETRPAAARVLVMGGGLLALFGGGLLVSAKIGGGADIHNMDAYAVVLMVIFAYGFFRRAAPEEGVLTAAQTGWLRAASVTLLVFALAWFAGVARGSFWEYDAAQSQRTLAALQGKMDEVRGSGGQVLFITQRHLISMGMLKNVTLVPEYEREELMEMAMAQNEDYLRVFRADLEAHRFAAIIVDPLTFKYVGEQDLMGAENNAWTRYVIRPILCNYQAETVFDADRIAIYVPQTDGQKCP